MTGRARVFSHPEIIQLASEQFVPVAENVSDLQVQQDAKGEFFRRMAVQGHVADRMAKRPGELVSHQGSFVFTPDGAFLASCNSLDPTEMAAMMRAGLARWDELATAPVSAAASNGDDLPVDAGYPEDGLVLHLVARDLPRTEDEHPISPDDPWARAWNHDFVWLTRDEARALVPEPRVAGSRRDVAWPVVRRLARFHLRDIVRGEPFVWPDEAVERAELWTEITGVEGSEIRLTVSGSARMSREVRWVRDQDGEPRHSHTGYECEITGEAIWDDEAGVFRTFDLLAAGPRWGSHKYNVREHDPGPAPLAIAFGIAGRGPWERTPPHVLHSRQAGQNQSGPFYRYHTIKPHDYFG